MSRCDRPVPGNDQHAGRNTSAVGAAQIGNEDRPPNREACLAADRQRKVVAGESNELVARCNCEAHLGQTARTTQHDDVS